MTLPKPSEQTKAAFQKLVPPDPAVTTRPMFGNLAGFVNGNMFCGLFGEDLFVRVSDEDQAKVRKQGGRAFEPMPGRAMTGYGKVREDREEREDGCTEEDRPGAASALASLQETGRSQPRGITRDVFLG
jgi:TfoX/Sxy family transcriptional regulator of competence genes